MILGAFCCHASYGKLYWNEHFWLENILKFPKISFTTHTIERILQKI